MLDMATNILTTSTSTSESVMRNRSVPISSDNDADAAFLSSTPAFLRYFFRRQDVLLTMSLGMLVSLLHVANGSAGENLVPTPFVSHPSLLHVLVILNWFASAAALILILLDLRHSRVNCYLSRFAFTTITVGFYLFTSVLLPSYLKPIPCILLSIVVLVMLYSSKPDLRRTRDSHADDSANPSNLR